MRKKSKEKPVPPPSLPSVSPGKEVGRWHWRESLCTSRSPEVFSIRGVYRNTPPPPTPHSCRARRGSSLPVVIHVHEHGDASLPGTIPLVGGEIKDNSVAEGGVLLPSVTTVRVAWECYQDDFERENSKIHSEAKVADSSSSYSARYAANSHGTITLLLQASTSPK